MVETLVALAIDLLYAVPGEPKEALTAGIVDGLEAGGETCDSPVVSDDGLAKKILRPHLDFSALYRGNGKTWKGSAGRFPSIWGGKSLSFSSAWKESAIYEHGCGSKLRGIPRALRHD